MGSGAEQLPFRLMPLSESESERVRADFPGYPGGLQSVLPWRFKVSGTATEDDLSEFYQRQPRPGDVWVCSPPKCGSMWTQELVWLLYHQLNYASCRRMLTDRWVYRESPLSLDLQQRLKHKLPEVARCQQNGISGDHPSSPTFVKTHMPLSLCPAQLLDTCKMVYVARNPKDICISFYKHARRYKLINFQKGLDVFARHFLDGTIAMTPVIPHMVEAWNLRHHRNLCFLFYEDMKRDLTGQIEKVASFLGRRYSSEEIGRLADYLHIDNFRNNPWRKEDFGKHAGIVNEGEGEFIRTGKAGDWKNHMSEAMSAEFDVWMERQLEGTDLTFSTDLQHQD